MTTILMNRLPLQSQKIDHFWKQVKKRVDKEVALGTKWLTLSRWLSLMLEHMESPSTSAVASINFSIDIDFNPLAAAEAALSEMKIDDKLATVTKKGGPSGVAATSKTPGGVDRSRVPTIPAGRTLRPVFKPEAWKAACSRMNTTIGDKNGKKPCANYFITQGFCPFPTTCPHHHDGVAGACSPPDTERQADPPSYSAKGRGGKRKHGGR